MKKEMMKKLVPMKKETKVHEGERNRDILLLYPQTPTRQTDRHTCSLYKQTHRDTHPHIHTYPAVCVCVCVEDAVGSWRRTALAALSTKQVGRQGTRTLEMLLVD